MNELPQWLRQMLFDLYHPLGKRRMAEATAPLAKALNQAAEAMQKMTRR